MSDGPQKTIDEGIDMDFPNLNRHHSSEVSLTLVTPWGEYNLAQIGPEFVIFRDSEAFPPCDADIVMTVKGVDGGVSRWQVRLPDGASSNDLKARTKDR